MKKLINLLFFTGLAFTNLFSSCLSNTLIEQNLSCKKSSIREVYEYKSSQKKYEKGFCLFIPYKPKIETIIHEGIKEIIVQ